jgi:hypothetical protein
MKATAIEHQFVKSIPKTMAQGVLYVSMEFATAGHKCCCGCGNEVFTRLSPNDWQLTYDGRTISLYPSIGNWNFPCQSHYWIKGNQILWDKKWSKIKIDALRRREFADAFTVEESVPEGRSRLRSFWSRIFHRK